MQDDLLSQGLDSDIALVHERFVTAMQQRLPRMPLATKERYFALVSTLVGKLEVPEKELRDIVQEMMSTAAAILMQEMNASR